jgi:peptide/nickel transport system ATP-binding protein
MRCGEQVAEAIWTALGTSRKEARLRAVQWLEQVQLPTPKDLAQRYPHELSGGQRQRVMIAMAMAREPSLLICDEPTTALDAHVQEEILDLIRDLQARHGTAVLFITHDLGVVRRCPLPTVSDFLEHKTVVREERPRRIPVPGEVPLLKVEGITKSFSGPVLQGLDLEIYPGETVGLVGESGSGKSTLARCLVRLEHPDGGRVWWKGQPAQEALSPRDRARRIQYIFQDPFSSLPPHRTILQILDEPLRLHGSASTPAEREKKAAELLEGVGLHAQDLPKYPHQFSGGQRQRVGIARALAVQPELLVCDESVSALDVSVQAQVLNLLHELKDRFGFSILFISHDLRVVQYMADRLLVLRHGKWDAVGDPSELLHRPPTPYLKQLASHLVEE